MTSFNMDFTLNAVLRPRGTHPVMSSVSSPSLDLQNLHLGFSSKRALRSLRRRTGTCICTSQEGSTLESKRRQQSSSGIGKTRSVAKDESLISKSHISQQDGLPPLVSALKASAAQNVASFHFPGHNRGHAAPSSLTQLIGLRPFVHDLPELPELDNLFSPEGPILEAQRLAAELFGSKETWFLVGGTTCGIQAAIMATCSPGEHIILPRNSHISAMSAMVLSGAIPKYIIPEYNCNWDIAGGITPSQVNKAIKELEMEGQKPAAVFVTSPTYHGICSNLSEISKLCHSCGIPVIVDEAHGAHLGLHPQMPRSALKLGADLVVQSTHKVLCSLTQSSMLHMSGDIVDRERICRSLQTLQSTSPSYLLLASLDAARAQLGENPETIFNEAMKLATEAKILIKKIPGITLLELSSFSKFPAIDPLRLTVGSWKLSLSGYEADDILDRNHGIVSELVGRRSITFAINLGTCKEHVQRLVSGLQELSACSLQIETTEAKVKDRGHEPFPDISMSLNPRDAFFANKRKVSIGESLGKVCGELICPYPPGIPVMIPGEIITERALDYLKAVRRKGVVITGASDPLLSSLVICDV
ncbi:arginine decarboxylase [Manihot esculenta]|nr:arginine decarboxylase [Manihot esculenta]